MKKIKVSWDMGVFDPTGFLHSFPKSLATSIKASHLSSNIEDIIATTGFAFRIWVEGKTLCPSAMSIFDFNLCKEGLENAGYSCEYISRMWDQGDIEQERRLYALDAIKRSIDSGIAPVVWDVGVPEWGLITGYSDEKDELYYLSVTGQESELPYKKLGRREIPILSVTIPTEKTNRSEELILKDTIKIIINHAKGGEWSDNVSGLEAYKALKEFFVPKNIKGKFSFSTTYYLGTYASLRYYAWKYFDKFSSKYSELLEIAACYEHVYKNLKQAFDIIQENKNPKEEILVSIQKKIAVAGEFETKCIKLLEKSSLV